MGLFANSLLGALFAGERMFQLLQGKGMGSHSIAAEIRAARSLLPPRATVFDVGANQGEYARLLLREDEDLVSHVHLFEPSHVHQAALNSMAAPRVTINYAGLGSKAETRKLYSDKAGSGLSSLYERNLVHKGITFDRAETVEIWTLDDYVEAKKVDRIALLKLDVEGHELAVLEGAKKTLSAGRIATVQFEFGGCNIDSRTYFRDFWALLTGYGFQISLLSPLFGLFPIARYTEALECFRTTNYFAYR